MKTNQTNLSCPKCQSNKLQFQLVNIQDIVPRRHSFIWWILVGWWWVTIKWLFLYFLMGFFVIPLKMLLPKNKRISNDVKNYKICKDCGHHWR
jgi:hypothetical protein